MDAEDLRKRFEAGEWVAIGHRLYAMCEQCGNLVRLNKPIFGSIHLCEPR